MKVGDLVNFLIVKAIPDHDAYLTCIMGGELLALLPKRFAGKAYKVGESGWAAIFNFHRGGRVTLSRTSPQFIRRYLEYAFRDFLKDNAIAIKRVARIRDATFYKIACATALEQRDLYERFKGATPHDFKEQIGETIIPIRYSGIPEEYALNALFPAPIEQARGVYYYSEMEVVTIYVDMDMIGRFAGKKGRNVATAAKLIGKEIELKGLEAVKER